MDVARVDAKSSGPKAEQKFESEMKTYDGARALVTKFQTECPKHGRGKERAGFSWAEYRDETYAKREVCHGSKDVMQNKTAFAEMLEAQGYAKDEIDEKWSLLYENCHETEKDLKGPSADPERIPVPTEVYILRESVSGRSHIAALDRNVRTIEPRTSSARRRMPRTSE